MTPSKVASTNSSEEAIAAIVTPDSDCQPSSTFGRGSRKAFFMFWESQTTAQAAQAMGVTKAELLSWSADSGAPGVTGQAALQACLEVDGRQLRGLVLRGQMRLVQARIRN